MKESHFRINVKFFHPVYLYIDKKLILFPPTVFRRTDGVGRRGEIGQFEITHGFDTVGGGLTRILLTWPVIPFDPFTGRAVASSKKKNNNVLLNSIKVKNDFRLEIRSKIVYRIISGNFENQTSPYKY